jgi:hypothetical protein
LEPLLLDGYHVYKKRLVQANSLKEIKIVRPFDALFKNCSFRDFKRFLKLISKRTFKVLEKEKNQF